MILYKNTISRMELYERVWQKPLRDIAPGLNISDSGLAKLCDRHGIPRPHQGYWMQLKHGKAVEKPALPEVEGRGDRAIRLPVENKSTFELRDDEKIPLVTKSRSHPLVVVLRKDYVGAGVNEYGRLVTEVRRDVDVSRAQFTRALSILSTVLHSIEAAGYSAQYVSHKSRDYRAIELTIEGETMSLAINETATRSDRELSPGQQKDLAHYGYCFGQRWDYTPSGKLTFSLSGMGLYGTQKSWSDGKSRTLESRLPDILNGIVVATQHLKMKRQEQEEHARCYKIARRREQRLEKVEALLKRRVEMVEQMVSNFKKSEEIRACLSSLEGSGEMENLPVSDRRLIRWAYDLARHYDPRDEFGFEGRGC